MYERMSSHLYYVGEGQVASRPNTFFLYMYIFMYSVNKICLYQPYCLIGQWHELVPLMGGMGETKLMTIDSKLY